MQRIMTPEQRAAHVARHRKGIIATIPPQATTEAEHCEIVGDLAACNCNQGHNPYTGFNEFGADTPEWVIEVARKRGWSTRKGALTVAELDALYPFKPNAADKRRACAHMRTDACAGIDCAACKAPICAGRGRA